MPAALLWCPAMFDSMSMRAQISAATARFAERIAALLARELKNARPQQSANALASSPASPSRARKSAANHTTPSPAPESSPRQLIVQRTGGPRIIPVPRGSQLPPRTLDDDPLSRLGQPSTAESAERIRKRVLRLVMGSSDGFTLQQMSTNLRLTTEKLTPVVDQLVGDRSLRALPSGNTMVYRRARVEPIRRKRDDNGASAV